MSWTDERISLLKKMWKEGKSAADIAKMLAKGVTRNAVIGKAHRMGLSGRPSPIKKPAPAAKKEKTVIKLKETKPVKEASKPVIPPPFKSNAMAKEPTPPVRFEKEAIPPGGGVALIDLSERMCKWPIGDPREDDFTFCGRNIRPGTPYCPDHASMAYQSSSRSRAAAAEEKVVEESADEEEVGTVA
jgi:GcrA cell cycle regulator